VLRFESLAVSLMGSLCRLNMTFSLNGCNIKRTIYQSYSHTRPLLSAFTHAHVDPVPTPFLLATTVMAHPVTAGHVCFPSTAGCPSIESKGGMVGLWKIFHFQNLDLLLFLVTEATFAQSRRKHIHSLFSTSMAFTTFWSDTVAVTPLQAPIFNSSMESSFQHQLTAQRLPLHLNYCDSIRFIT
jgi:hypothetical protein